MIPTTDSFQVRDEIDLSVVVPVFNEEENLESLFAQLVRVLESLSYRYEIVAVDDGSRDGSFAILQRLHAANSRIKVVRFRRNFGQTAAFAAGFERARGEVVVTIDADLQNDPADIPRLLDKMAEGYDVVSGWRKDRQDCFLGRKLPSMIANRLISVVTGIRLHDYGCSLKAYHRDVIKNVHLYGELHRFIPALASWMGVSVAELPVAHNPRRFGRSKYGLSRTVRVVLDLLTVRFMLSYSARPMQLFGGLGLLSFVLGTISGLYLSAQKVIHGYTYSIDRPLLLLSVLLIVVGVQMVSMGLLGELVVRTYHEAQGKPIYVIREILE
jgi:glycosyltransferase involved in cell wall biosynthesis